MNEPRALLQLIKVGKSYARRVLDEVDFEVQPGEVHALVGENGAGKSTLARIMAGLTQPDAGEMRLNGAVFAPTDKAEAERAGIRLVMQELNLLGNLSVAENIFFDHLPHRLGWIDYPRLNTAARAIMEELGLGDVQASRRVKTLGVGQQQLVEIAAGLSRKCRILILDEPTAALTNPEIDRLFAQITRLKGSGVGLVYISHRLEEIQRLADRVTVLRDGKRVTTRQIRDVAVPEMVRLMVGRELSEALTSPPPPGPVALKVQGLCSGIVRQVSFELRQGEILGLAGLMGCGRTETVRAIFGADRPEAGEIYLRNSPRAARIRSPRDAVRQGMALLTEDRKAQGLLLPMSVRANLSLASLRKVSRWGAWMDLALERTQAAHWTRVLDVRCASGEQAISHLSGGNQQKVIIARWLFRACDVLMFDEPTRGIDVGAKFDIYRLLGQLAEEGKAILVVSSDLKDLLTLSHRLIVMSAGRITASFAAREATEEAIMAAALRGYLEKKGGAP